MNKRIGLSVLIAVLFCVPICLADSDIPNLLGTWAVKSEAGLLVKGRQPGPATHHKEPFSALNAEATFVKQQGRILQGTFKSPRAIEDFVAAIGHDNKTLYFADQDGFLDGRIIDKDTIEVVYRHATPADTVVAVGIWTRKK